MKQTKQYQTNKTKNSTDLFILESLFWKHPHIWDLHNTSVYTSNRQIREIKVSLLSNILSIYCLFDFLESFDSISQLMVLLGYLKQEINTDWRQYVEMFSGPFKNRNYSHTHSFRHNSVNTQLSGCNQSQRTKQATKPKMVNFKHLLNNSLWPLLLFVYSFIPHSLNFWFFNALLLMDVVILVLIIIVKCRYKYWLLCPDMLCRKQSNLKSYFKYDWSIFFSALHFIQISHSRFSLSLCWGKNTFFTSF